MTDAFRCDICEEFYCAHFRFIEAEMDTDAVAQSGFTLEDIGPDVFGVFPEHNGDTQHADICAECGRKAVEALIELKIEVLADD